MKNLMSNSIREVWKVKNGIGAALVSMDKSVLKMYSRGLLHSYVMGSLDVLEYDAKNFSNVDELEELIEIYTFNGKILFNNFDLTKIEIIETDLNQISLGKIKYYSRINSTVIHNADSTLIKALNRNKAGVEITYSEGTSSVAIKTISCNGVQTIRTPKVDKRGCKYIIRENTIIYINELIYNLTRLYTGLPIQIGEYNHTYPASWQDREIISMDAGDICSHEQNMRHWELCNKIYKITGKKCQIPSYSDNIYSLLGIDTSNCMGRLDFENRVDGLLDIGAIQEIKE